MEKSMGETNYTVVIEGEMMDPTHSKDYRKAQHTLKRCKKCRFRFACWNPDETYNPRQAQRYCQDTKVIEAMKTLAEILRA